MKAPAPAKYPGSGSETLVFTTKKIKDRVINCYFLAQLKIVKFYGSSYFVVLNESRSNLINGSELQSRRHFTSHSRLTKRINFNSHSH